MIIEFPKKAKQIITAPIPQQLIKERKGGGSMMLNYISGSSVIDILNNAFDYLWDWKVDEQWTRDSIPCFNKYSKDKDAVKVKDSYGNEGTMDAQGPVAHVKGSLTVYVQSGDNLIPITKTGYGSKSIMGKQNDQESIYKAAGTDALKKAASLFGIGAELYRDEDEQSYFDSISYEDPWTEELKVKFESQWNYISKVSEEYSLDEAALNDLVYNFSEGSIANIKYIIPDNIIAFYEYLKEQIEAIESAEEA